MGESVPPNTPWPDDLQTHGATFAQIHMSMEEPTRRLVTTMALEHANSVGIIDDKQSEALLLEVGAGKSNLQLIKTESHLKLRRVVSVGRVIVSRIDDRFFVEIGKISDGKFVVDVQYPGAKQVASEDIFTTVGRVVERLKDSIGDVVLKSCSQSQEVRLSKKVQVPTQYSFCNAYFDTVDVGDRSQNPRPNSEQFVSECSSSSISSDFVESSTAVRQFVLDSVSLVSWNSFFYRKKIKSTQSFSESLLKAIEEKFQSGNQLFSVTDTSDGRNETAVCMWLSEDEMDILKTSDGIKCLERLLTPERLAAASCRSRTLTETSGLDDSMDERSALFEEQLVSYKMQSAERGTYFVATSSLT